MKARWRPLVARLRDAFWSRPAQLVPVGVALGLVCVGVLARFVHRAAAAINVDTVIEDACHDLRVARGADRLAVLSRHARLARGTDLAGCSDRVGREGVEKRYAAFHEAAVAGMPA